MCRRLDGGRKSLRRKETWAWQGSNLRPLACKARALPLSYTPGSPARVRNRVPPGGCRHCDLTGRRPRRPRRAGGRRWSSDWDPGRTSAPRRPRRPPRDRSRLSASARPRQRSHRWQVPRRPGCHLSGLDPARRTGIGSPRRAVQRPRHRPRPVLLALVRPPRPRDLSPGPLSLSGLGGRAARPGQPARSGRQPGGRGRCQSAPARSGRARTGRRSRGRRPGRGPWPDGSSRRWGSGRRPGARSARAGSLGRREPAHRR